MGEKIAVADCVTEKLPRIFRKERFGVGNSLALKILADEPFRPAIAVPWILL
jgi:hypothetical protein